MPVTHPSPEIRRRRRAALMLAAIVAVSLTTAACGSSGSGGSGQKTTTRPESANTSHATLGTTTVPGYGTVLAAGRGAPLYMLTADSKGGSSCTGACAKQWPPLEVRGTPTPGPGITASLLSSFKRSDGTRQVLYNGHALYTHTGPSATAAAGTAADGGIWYLISPSGKPILTTTGSGY